MLGCVPTINARDGAVVKRERDMLGGILDLAEVEVHEIMVHRKSMVTIDADESPSRIVDQVIGCPYTRIPIWRGDPDDVVGVLHAKDILMPDLSASTRLRGASTSHCS